MIASSQSDRMASAARPQAYRRFRGLFLLFLTIAAPASFDLENVAWAAEPSKTEVAIEDRVQALDPAAVHAAANGDFAGLVDISGGRKMYLECRGNGSPTVVLVGGLRGSAKDWSIAEKSAPAVFPEVAKFTRVCAYDRPGTPVDEKPSRSDPVLQPTTAGDAVADLHALLSAAGELGPYVLVAHSYGGLVVRLYASTYPEDVCGLVLVDALSEGLRDAETPDQWAIQRKLLEGNVQEDLVLYPALERVDSDNSFDQVRAAPSLRPLPLVVLSADRAWGPQIPSMIAAGELPADVPPDFGYVTDSAQKEAQERLAKLVPHAKHITNTNSGHDIHKEQPQLVIEAIREIVEAVRNGSGIGALRPCRSMTRAGRRDARLCLWCEAGARSSRR
jgi:pimeloyl-ACP methyl ester carboxylesterase